MKREKKLETAEIEPVLLTAKQAAAVLGLSVSGLYALHNAGKVPLPRKLGRSARWSVDEFRDWDRAGCPIRADWNWQQMRSG